MHKFKKELKKYANPKINDPFIINKKTSFWKTLILMLPAIIIIAIFTIIPFFYAIQDGFTTNDSNAQTHTANWDNFKFVIKDPFFAKSIKNSLIYATLAVPLIIIISAIISSTIASVLRKRLRGIFQTIFFLPYVTSAISISLAFAFLFDYDVGLINKLFFKDEKMNFTNDTRGNNAMIVLISFGVWRGLAFNILIFTTAMLGVDNNKYKAASIDGAGPIKKFWKITLPSINKTTNFLIIIGIISAIKVFPLALFNNDPNNARTNGADSLMLYVYSHINDSNYGKGGVASLYLLIISILFSFILKGGLNQIIKFSNFLGEKHVENQIKNYKLYK